MTHGILISEFGGPEVLRWAPRDTPQPGPGQLRVQVEYSSVNYADIQTRQGHYDAGAKLPLTPGLDALGTVAALGEGVSGFELGQRVACFPPGGSYAEAILSPAHLTFALPGGVPDEAGASLVVLVTAYNILHHAARIQPGESVLIHAAAGGVGHLAVQLAQAAGAGQIIAVVGGPEKAEFVRGLGVSEVVDRHTEDFAGRVKALTDGRGADVILDSVGGETTERGLEVLAPFGRLVIYGHASGQEARVPSRPLHRQSKSVVGYSSGHHRQGRPEVIRQAADRVFGLVAAGQVRVHVGATLPLRDAAQAQTLVEQGQVLGRVLLRA